MSLHFQFQEIALIPIIEQMGNKLLSSPFPSFEQANGQLNAIEISHIKKNFLKLSHNTDYISYESFMQMKTSNVGYVRKHVFPRLFTVFDTKKDGMIDFEEYLCAIAMFRLGSADEKIKLLYFMYDGSKYGGNLVKDNFRQLLVDATICVQKEEIDQKVLESYVADMQLLSDAMVETALHQFSAHPGKLDINEFINFVKMEGTVQGMLHLIATLVDF